MFVQTQILLYGHLWFKKVILEIQEQLEQWDQLVLQEQLELQVQLEPLDLQD